MLPSTPMGSVEDNLRVVGQRIAAAARRSGREPSSIALLAVSKTMPAKDVTEAFDAGARLFGESRVQEAARKLEELEDRLQGPTEDDRATWHLIGRLQSNKARLAAAVFDAVQSIDRPQVVECLDSAAASLGRRLDAYVQVEFEREGASHEQISRRTAELCRLCDEAGALQLRGLMTLPPYSPEPEATRSYFVRLRELAERTAETTGAALPELSMGMTNDYEVAIEEGATIVRVGTALFGRRD